MRLSLERQVAAGFALGIAVLLLIGAATWWSLARFERAFSWVEHTHEVIAHLDQILIHTLNIQTGSRGYALSGDPQFLAPYRSGVDRIESQLVATRRLLDENPSQLRRLDHLETGIRELMSLMDRRNNLRHAGQLSNPAAEEFLRQGRIVMDDVRETIEVMIKHERRLLLSRTEETRRSAASTRLVLLLAIAGFLAFAAFAGTRLQRAFAARKRADLALQRSRSLFETLFEQATDALIVARPDGTIRRINRRTEELFSYSRSDLLGRPLEALMPERYRHRHLSHRTGYSAAPKFRAMGAGLELFGLRASGEEFPVDIMLSPLELDDGPAVLAAVRDITERKAAAEALKRSAAEIRDLYNHAPCGYHSLGPGGLIIAINDTELEWLGYTREEVEGRLRFTDLLGPENKTSFAEHFPRFIADGHIEDLEFQLRRKDGSTFFVSLSATAIYDNDGNYAMSRSTVHDITARRAAERRLARLHQELERHTADLEAANRELEAFSYSVSHDLRAPLRHLAGFASLLETHPGLNPDAEARRYLDVIQNAAKKMGQLIDDLLAFSRLGRAPLKPVVVDTHELVQRLVRDNVFDARPDTQWQIDPLPPISADPALLTQVWMNLLGNAAKYSRRAEPPIIAVQAQVAPTEVVFSVRDNGVGFEPRYAAKLFRVFSRLHSDSEFTGTGVGLALVERIVARHGGRVWAEGQPGQGATFFFTLPLDAERPSPDSVR